MQHFVIDSSHQNIIKTIILSFDRHTFCLKLVSEHGIALAILDLFYTLLEIACHVYKRLSYLSNVAPGGFCCCCCCCCAGCCKPPMLIFIPMPMPPILFMLFMEFIEFMEFMLIPPMLPPVPMGFIGAIMLFMLFMLLFIMLPPPIMVLLLLMPPKLADWPKDGVAPPICDPPGGFGRLKDDEEDGVPAVGGGASEKDERLDCKPGRCWFRPMPAMDVVGGDIGFAVAEDEAHGLEAAAATGVVEAHGLAGPAEAGLMMLEGCSGWEN